MAARHERASAASGADATHRYTLHPPLLPSWHRFRKLFSQGPDLSILRALEYELLEQMQFSGRILDFGGGRNANYREHMRQWMSGCVYETANIDAEIRPTYLIEAGQSLSISDNSYDIVITLNTLEHIFDIEAALRELLRVLMPGGQLVATVPFLFRIHGHPDDFLRGTPSWWERTLSGIGFAEIGITPLLWGPLSTGLSVAGIPGPFKRWRMRLALVLDMLYASRRCRGQQYYSGELAQTVCNSPLGFLITARKSQGT
jgi:SAM-dependent methyltransferase